MIPLPIYNCILRIVQLILLVFSFSIGFQLQVCNIKRLSGSSEADSGVGDGVEGRRMSCPAKFNTGSANVPIVQKSVVKKSLIE